ANIQVVPAQTGVAIDVPRTAASVLAAAERRTHRVARIEETIVRPSRTTAQARAMGISGIVGSYETFFGGIPNRIHNVEVVAHLVDNKMIAPGASCSFYQPADGRSAAPGLPRMHSSPPPLSPRPISSPLWAASLPRCRRRS